MENNPLRDQFLTNFCCGHKEISCSMERVSGLRELATAKASEQRRWNEMVFGRKAAARRRASESAGFARSKQ
jgi:hypothetical protein